VADRLQQLGLSDWGCRSPARRLSSGRRDRGRYSGSDLSHQLAGFITSLPGYLQTLHGLLAQWSERVTSDSINGWLQNSGSAALRRLSMRKNI
jgi:hypothetical protein